MDYKEYFDQKAVLFKNSADYTTEVRIMIMCRLLEIPIEYYGSFIDLNTELYNFLQITGSPPTINEKMIVSSLNKVSNGTKIIMLDDYNKLNEIVKRANISIGSIPRKSLEDINKDAIRMIIERLLSSPGYCSIGDDDKKLIEFYKIIYFIPIEISNPFVKNEYNDKIKYKEHLLMQWQTANEMAANVSQQRSNMNNFYMSLLTILIAGSLFSDYFTDTVESFIKIPLYICIMIIGVTLCKIWRGQINNYKKLNYAKFLVINEIERQLPANVMYYEYLITDKNPQKDMKRVSFSEQEKRITVLFEVFTIIVPIILILGSLKGTGAWTWVKGLLSI